MTAPDAKTFDEIVSTWTRTCEACPTQYEGQLADGRFFYFRYRFGRATLGIADTQDEAYLGERAAVEIGDELDGFLEHHEVEKVIVDLYTWATSSDRGTPA